MLLLRGPWLPSTSWTGLQRIAVHEFGVEGLASYDEDGFFLSLTAEGLKRDGGVTLRVHTNDHLPPHEHVQRPGEIDIRINLVSGDPLDALPAGTSAKKLRRFQKVQENHGLLSNWWEKNYGTPVNEV